MKKVALFIAVLLSVGSSLRALAQTDRGGKIRVGTQIMQFVYSTDTIELTGNSVDTTNSSFSIDGSEIGVNVGYLVSHNIELGGIFFFGYQDYEFGDEATGDTSVQSLRARVALYGQYNIYASSNFMFPVRVMAGYSRNWLDSQGLENTYNSFTFGGGLGVSYLPFDQGSIDLLIISLYSIGNFTGESEGDTMDRDYSRLDIGATIGLSLWF